MENAPKTFLRALGVGLAGLAAILPLPGASFPQIHSLYKAVPAFSRPLGRSGGPVQYLFRSGEGSWHIASIGPSGVPETALLRLDAPYEDLQLRLDASGRLWLAGEEMTAAGSIIKAGMLEKEAFGDSRTFGSPGSWNDGADLYFPAEGGLWVAWHRVSGSAEAILAEEPASGRRWRITPEGASALSPPRIAPDGFGGFWILWTGRIEGTYVVAARRWEGNSWSGERRLFENGEKPCLQPDAALGRDGVLRAAWSSFDGSRYRIQAAELSDGGWTDIPLQVKKTGTGQNPRLVTLDDGRPAVLWADTGMTGTRLLGAVCDGSGIPAEPFVVSGKIPGPQFEAAGTDDGLFVIHPGPEGARTECHRTAALLARPFRGAEEARVLEEPPGGAGAAVSESRYIGFGDSITYGYIDSTEAPELGYIPRLDAKLDEVFGPTDVINEGYPGELTAHGLGRIEAVLAARQARYILVMEGTNDVKLFNNAGPVEVVLYNLKEICLRSRAFGTMPILSTVCPRNDWIWNYPKYRNRHIALEAGIRALAPQIVVPFVDMEAVFNANGGADALISDGVHPNIEGYKLMTETWYAAIRALPFPPLHPRLWSKEGMIFQALPAPENRLQNGVEHARVTLVRQIGYLLFWQANPKTADASSLLGYRVYRKKRGENAYGYVRIGEASGVCAFLDRGITAAETYDYVITAVAINGVEGAPSETVSND